MVRVSGPLAFKALAALAPSAATHASEHRKLARARLRGHAGAEIDDALYVRFVGPESYTGEDVVEFHLHGGSFIASRLLEELHALGARQALPGEFSFRAVRNGKMTVNQAQAVADLISSANEGAVSLALEKLSGSQNRLIGRLGESLRHLAVLGEAGIDFADQDIDEVSLPQLRKRLVPIIADLETLKSSYDRGSRLQDGLRVAFVGLPNAGKSSFFNALLGEDRSIVSDLAGTTRDVVREQITLRGSRASITLRLEDTAGLRTADHPVEKIGIERSQKSAREADLVLLLVDPLSRPAEVLAQWNALGRPRSKTLGIFTKADLLSAQQQELLQQSYPDYSPVPWLHTSSMTGAGIPQAVEAITAFCEQWVHRTPGEVLLTHLDQLHVVEDALEHLSRAQTAPEIDLFAADVRQALHALGRLIGETLPDDILGKIFSEFCIGK
jgi:tRNA modification GTPase